MARIYSGIQAEVLTTEAGNKQVYIYDVNGDRYRPNLILPDLLAAKNLRDYLNKLIKKNRGCFKDTDEPLEEKLK